MPFQAQQNLFNNPEKKEQKPLRAPLDLENFDFHENVDEGVKELIKEGDHIATILGRVLAGMHTPQLTINNALDKWNNVVAGFENND